MHRLFYPFRFHDSIILYQVVGSKYHAKIRCRLVVGQENSLLTYLQRTTDKEDS